MLDTVCRGMQYLHEQLDLAHGDLACRNVLVKLAPDGRLVDARISDLGRVLRACKNHPLFAPPFSFTQNADVGAFGMMLYRLLTGEVFPESLVVADVCARPAHVCVCLCAAADPRPLAGDRL